MRNVRHHTVTGIIKLTNRDAIYGVVVDRSGALLLLAGIRRAQSGIFFLAPHDFNGSRLDNGVAWNPHASYHTDGKHHVKSYNEVVLTPVRRQPLDAAFKGSEPLFDLGLRPGDWARSPLVTDPSTFKDFFRIPASMLNLDDNYTVSAQLIAPGAVPAHRPYDADLVAEEIFRDAHPWIHVSSWRVVMPLAAA